MQKLFTNTLFSFWQKGKKITFPEICPKCSLGSSDNIINEYPVTVLSPINSIQFSTGGILGFMQMKDWILCYIFLVNFQYADLIATVYRRKKESTHIYYKGDNELLFQK